MRWYKMRVPKESSRDPKDSDGHGEITLLLTKNSRKKVAVTEEILGPLKLDLL